MGDSKLVVVEEVSGWLRVYSDGSVDRKWTGPPEAAPLLEHIPPTCGAFVDGVATHDVILDASSDVLLRIYIPETSGGEKIPVLLHFQGGGFCISRPTWFMYHAFYSRLVKSVPAVCVSVQTRLAPENRLPAAVHDCLSALTWLRSSPDLLPLGVDLARVFLIGDSSGGNLVHQVAALTGDVSPLRIAGAIPIHPGFVRSTRSESEKKTENESPILTVEMVDKLLGMAVPEGSTKDHPIICPMGPEAAPMEEVELPPLMVVVAEKDLMKDTQMEYVEAVKGAGKEVEVLVNRGMMHCFYFNEMMVKADPKTGEETKRLVEGIVDFIRRH
ncbi:putative carboxylesterase 6 [Acorus calamus]|uniref:Carboxylesterase 6 n=1 Tax=Acorus calamus TaxID=4465 RepID=A0AAV9FHZ9_ACOCL|nr:putative carboxylesterase 6 [Acorus calamus]